MRRIGVFGGTFDPVHTGHLILAEIARVQANLDRVLFMPAHIQPFKQDVDVSPDDDRLRMLKLALAGNPSFDVTTVEIDKGGVSYTIDSLRELQREYKEARICFIIGMDMFLMMHKWKDADALMSEFDFAIGVRPGYPETETAEKAEDIRRTYGSRVDLLDNPAVEISSTEIRSNVQDGASIRYQVPESVRRYLLVRKAEGEERFAHTKRVIDLAVGMAKRFGADAGKTATAALLHDYCKDPAGGAENDVGHGAMAAEAARYEFGIDDEDILNAICYHTTGRAGMSKLERIIFLADTVEPGRTYDSIAQLRDTCLTDLNEGTLTVLVELKKYLERKGIAVSPDTEAAIEDLKRDV